MASGDLAGKKYVFHLEGIMWANSLTGGKYHKPDDLLTGQLLNPTVHPSVERPVMTGFVGSQYTNDSWPFSGGAWPPSEPPPPKCLPVTYVPNAGLYPFSEIGTFLFTDERNVEAFIRWNFAGILNQKFARFTGKYEVDDPDGGATKLQPFLLPRVGMISLSAADVGGSPLWDYAFLFADPDQRTEAVLMAAGRLPRPGTGSGRMLRM